MDFRGIERAERRLKRAEKLLNEIGTLCSDVTGIETLWYDFLVNFNNVFSQLEQASKITEQDKKWYSDVKTIRKSDKLLCYLHHARNFEEHSLLSSVIGSNTISKPLKRTPTMEFIRESTRSGDYSLSFEGETVSFEVLSPRIRLRTVVDKGIAYEFPNMYSNPLLAGIFEADHGGQVAEGLSAIDAVWLAVNMLKGIVESAKQATQ